MKVIILLVKTFFSLPPICTNKAIVAISTYSTMIRRDVERLMV